MSTRDGFPPERDRLPDIDEVFTIEGLEETEVDVSVGNGAASYKLDEVLNQAFQRIAKLEDIIAKLEDK